MIDFKALICAGIVALSTSYAYAQSTASSSLTVGGQVNSTTCLINGVSQNGANNTTLNFALPTMSAADFAGAGKVSPVYQDSRAVISLTGCPGSSNVTLTLIDTFGNWDSANQGWINTATTGAAKNIEIRLVNATGGSNTTLVAGTGITSTTSASGTTSWTLGAQYLATGVAVAGVVQSKADFTITYP